MKTLIKSKRLFNGDKKCQNSSIRVNWEVLFWPQKIAINVKIFVKIPIHKIHKKRVLSDAKFYDFRWNKYKR
jgi:hypothetical protein